MHTCFATFVLIWGSDYHILIHNIYYIIQEKYEKLKYLCVHFTSTYTNIIFLSIFYYIIMNILKK